MGQQQFTGEQPKSFGIGDDPRDLYRKLPVQVVDSRIMMHTIFPELPDLTNSSNVLSKSTLKHYADHRDTSGKWWHVVAYGSPLKLAKAEILRRGNPVNTPHLTDAQMEGKTLQQKFLNSRRTHIGWDIQFFDRVGGKATINGKTLHQLFPAVFPNRRRLVSLPKIPGFQEPLYGHHSIQPSETSHAVGYVEADEGTSLGDLATDPAAASVLLGIVLVFLGALCLRRFRKGERRQERTSYDDNG